MKGRFWCAAVALAMGGASLLSGSLSPRLAAQRAQEAGLRIAGEFLIVPGTGFPEVGTARFGAISGLAALPGGCEFLGLSDDHNESRVYRLRLRGGGTSMQVVPLSQTLLQRTPGAPSALDPEGIALTKSGTILVSSEGVGTEPRLPPAIVEYAQDGRFIRQLPVPPRFVPNQKGPLRTGVRRNGGFESLTITPDFTRLYTATELALTQDGPDGAFLEAQRVRIVEYVADAASYRPAREFVYELSALEQPQFVAGFSVNGLSELLAVNGTELLALERGFVQIRGGRLGVNRIRLFRIALDEATDVSTLDSLAGRKDVKPVRKTLVQDFSALAGRSLRLLNLENFEGLAWVGGGSGPDRSLLAVSDDNFNAFQVTAFLLLEPGAAPARPPACP
jgi:hypothetical protein